MTACLDSWAVLAWLDDEQPAAGRVDKVIGRSPVMSWINAVEVHYRVARDHGERAADELLDDLRRILTLELPGVVRMTQTARLKATMPIALADCFAIATAAANDVPLLTGDPEIVRQSGLPCPVQDLRAGR